jgi:hypothetical protein
MAELHINIERYICTILMNTNSHYSYRKRDIEHLLTLTDSFTWEELPTRDPDTGYLTKAGYIPIIQTLAAYIPVALVGFHLIHSTVRIVLNHDMVYTTWYPFEASVSPVFEIANLTQVIIPLIFFNFLEHTFYQNQNGKFSNINTCLLLLWSTVYVIKIVI